MEPLDNNVAVEPIENHHKMEDTVAMLGAECSNINQYVESESEAPSLPQLAEAACAPPSNIITKEDGTADQDIEGAEAFIVDGDEEGEPEHSYNKGRDIFGLSDTNYAHSPRLDILHSADVTISDYDLKQKKDDPVFIPVLRARSKSDLSKSAPSQTLVKSYSTDDISPSGKHAFLKKKVLSIL